MLMEIVDLFLHLDTHLSALIADVGLWIYPILFLVIFCETGLVVTPILPGDSLLFAVGALAALDGSTLKLAPIGGLLFAAAVLGDACNYLIGKRIGTGVFTERSRFFKLKHLEQTQDFYARHGGKTIILARFVPIVRTFAPFVAGVGRMGYRQFASYNVVGAALWVVPLLVLGNLLGNTPAVKSNFHYVVFAIIFISILPALVQVVRAKTAKKTA